MQNYMQIHTEKNSLLNPLFILQFTQNGLKNKIKDLQKTYKTLTFMSNSFSDDTTQNFQDNKMKKYFLEILGLKNINPNKMYNIHQDFMKCEQNCLNIPMILAKSGDQVIFRSSGGESNSHEGSSKERAKNYGNVLLEISDYVSDGIIVYFCSMELLEEVLQEWEDDSKDNGISNNQSQQNNMRSIYQAISQNTVLFSESKNLKDTQKNIENFKKSCDIGKGGIFLASIQGPVPNLIKFNYHYSRATILFGYNYSEKDKIKDKNNPMLEGYKWKDQFRIFRDISIASMSTIKSREDYSLLVLVDEKFSRLSVNEYVPKIFKAQADNQYIDMGYDFFLAEVQKFFKQIDTCVKLSIKY